MKKVALAISLCALFSCTEGDLNVTTDMDGFEERLVLAAKNSTDTKSYVIFIGDTDEDDDVIFGDESNEQEGVTTSDDIVIAVYNDDADYVYLLNQTDDEIARVFYNETSEEIQLSSSLSVEAKDGEGNPYDFLKLDSSMGYVALYDSKYLIQIDPSEADEDDFITNQLDLRDFSSDGASSPNAVGLVRANGFTYVLLQSCITGYSCVVLVDENSDDEPVLISHNDDQDEFDPSEDDASDVDLSDYYIDLALEDAEDIQVTSNLVFVTAPEGIARIGDVSGEFDESDYDDGEENYLVTLLVDDDYDNSDDDDGVDYLEGDIDKLVLISSSEFYFSTEISSEDYYVYHYSKSDDNDDDYDDEDYTIEFVSLDDSDNTYYVTSLGYDSFFDHVYIGVGSTSSSDDVGLMTVDMYGDEGDNAVDEDLFIDTTYKPTQIEALN